MIRVAETVAVEPFRMRQRLRRQLRTDDFKLEFHRRARFVVFVQRERERINARSEVRRDVHFHPHRIPDRRIGIQHRVHILFEQVREQTGDRAFESDPLRGLPPHDVAHALRHDVHHALEPDERFERRIRRFQLHRADDVVRTAVGDLERILFSAQGGTFFQAESTSGVPVRKHFRQRENNAAVKHGINLRSY